jgi:general secretion pathway protein A
MYCDHFGFREKPFTITPNPRFIFISKNHREAFAHLLYGIDNHAGFVELTGEVGTGKTTVLRTLLSQLDDDSHRIALIFNPVLSPVELLRSVNREFGLPWEGLDRAELLDTLNRYLLAENRKGHTVALVIDEAQNLDPAALEQIRLISNLETETDKLIQIILAGQPELDSLLQKPELRQLGQRITVRYSLSSMDYEDTRAYIEHRIEVAGGRGATLFKPAAIKRIYSATGGVPRLINIICDRALLIAYTEEHRTVSDRIAARAIAELQGKWRRIPPLSGFQRATAAGAGLLAIAAVAGMLAIPKETPKQPEETQKQPPPAVQTAVRPDLIDALQREQSSLSEKKSAVQAFNALAPLWKVKPIGSGEKFKGGQDLERMAGARGLQLLKFSGGLDLLLRSNSPAILEYALPGVAGMRYLALTKSDNDRLLIAPPLLGRTSFSKTELGSFWIGRGYIPWKNFRQIPLLAGEGTSGPEVKRLQELLRTAGPNRDPPTGVYDAATIAAIKKFQAERGIKPDGMAGTQTLILLYQVAGGYSPPLLTNHGEGLP